MSGWRLTDALVQYETFAKQADHRAAVRLRKLAGTASQLSVFAAARVWHMCASTGGAIVPLAPTSDSTGRGWVRTCTRDPQAISHPI